MPKVYLKKQTKHKCKVIENYFYSEKKYKDNKAYKIMGF